MAKVKLDKSVVITAKGKVKVTMNTAQRVEFEEVFWKMAEYTAGLAYENTLATEEGMLIRSFFFLLKQIEQNFISTFSSAPEHVLTLTKSEAAILWVCYSASPSVGEEMLVKALMGKVNQKLI
ncbi:hypothetical protein [Rufibacter quisquiliarum]|uniref:Uncharacterized protein n=1 Tax=Rufibacter quisquiliarum TaxID=1549639 RepID=A0A839GX14_9BACT|nr:hypothetical protein [Rufibacter quisquiliarum]MBA9078968.1 hypothetical protein [Rufibacter quisquiliarum]